MNYYIYALCEPNTRTIRYIGASANLKRRLIQHISSTKTKRSSPLCNWLRSLSNRPTLIVLKETTEADWQDYERLFIRNAKMLGMALVNATDGGLNCSLGPETRAKLSAAHMGVSRGPHSPEHRAAISDSHTGVPLSPEHCAAIGTAQKGVPLSPQHCAALSAAHKGVPLSPEHCAAIGTAQKGRLKSPEHCAALSAAKLAYYAARRAAAKK